MLERVLFLGHHPATGAPGPVTGQAVVSSGPGGGVWILVIGFIVIMGIAFWLSRKKNN